MPSPFCALLDAAHTLNAAPGLEMHQDEHGYQVTFAAPGVPSKDLRIEVVSGGILRIAGQHRHARFERSIRLPKEADLDQAEVTHSDGLLSIFVPKLAKAAPRQLTIQPADAGPMDEDNDATFRWEVAAPGVRREDLKITLSGNVLHVAGETKGERRHAAIDRKLRLPEGADASRTIVTHADGLLCFYVAPKAAHDAQPRQLAIEAAAAPRPLKINASTPSPDETPPAA